MQPSRPLRVMSWSLLAISGAAGLGLLHLFISGWSRTSQQLVDGAAQLLSLVLLMLIALRAQGKKHHDP